MDVYSVYNGDDPFTTVFTILGITLTIEGSEQCDPAGRMRPLSGLAIRSKYRVEVPR
jgi:hypothetical protein